MSAGPTDKATAEQVWRAFKRRHAATATLDIILPDLAGIARGKRLSVGASEGVLAGLTFASSIYGIDSCGVNVDASGLIWEEGDADRPCLVDWATLAPVPWRDGGAQVLAGLGEHGGGAFFADPRAVLAGVAGRFSALGLQAVCALELEFYLLREQARGRSAGPRRVLPDATPGQVYGLQPLEDREGF